MYSLILKIKNHFNILNLEKRILFVSMLSGTFICFASSIGNFVLNLGTYTTLIPFIMGIIYLYFLYALILKSKYELAAYGTLTLLTIFVFPFLWFLNGGISGSIPYFYIFMIFLSTVVLNKHNYKIMTALQLIVVISLIIAELNLPHLITEYESTTARVIDVGVSLVIIIFLLFFMTIYIMKAYHKTITELELAHEELKKSNKQLHHTSITDELTGLYNRRFIIDILNEIIDHNKINHTSLIMLDIDYFKNINDTYGHSVGDEVLQRIGKILLSNNINKHHISRIGGEEFLILTQSKLNHIEEAEEIRGLIEMLKWREENLKVTVSLGVHSLTSDDSLESALKSVDSALYEAKNNGRNQVFSSFHSVDPTL